MRNLFFALIMTSSTALCAFSGDDASISMQDNYLYELAQSDVGGHSLSRCHHRQNPVTPSLPSALIPQYGRFQADSEDLIFPARDSGPAALVSVPFNVNLSQYTSGMELVSVDGHNPLDRAIKITVAGDYYVDFGASAVRGDGGPHLIGLSINGVFPVRGTVAIDDLTNASTIISITERDLPALLQVVNAGSTSFKLFNEGSFSAFLTIVRLNDPVIRQ